MKKKTLFFFFFFLPILAFSQSNISFYADNTFGCAPLVVTFTNNSYIDVGVAGPVTYSWSIDGQMVSASDTTFVDTLDVGYHNIYLEAYDNNGGFVGDYWEDINIEGNPKYFWISAGGMVCPGEEIRFDFDWYSESEFNATWNFGDNSQPAYGNSISHKYLEEGTYPVELIISCNCGTDTLTRDVVVSNNTVPEINIYTKNGDHFCPGDVVQFETEGMYNSYHWIFDDGTESFNPSPLHVFSTIGEYNVILESENLCGNIGSDTILVNIGSDLPADAGFNFWPGEVCPGEPITFEPYSSGKHTWDFGGGIINEAPKPIFAFIDTGDYAVQHVIENGCGLTDTTEQYIRVDYTYQTVYDYIGFSIENKDNYGYDDTIRICPGEELIFRNNSSTNNLKFQWIFSNGDTIRQVNANKVFNDVGVFEMYLKAINSCRGEGYSNTRVIIVDDGIMPHTALSAAPRYMCPGEMVYFWDEKSDPSQSLYSYDIIFGDGGQANDIVEIENMDFHTLARHTYAAEGNYDFIFTATNICGNTDTLSGTIMVNSSNTFKPFYYVNNSTAPEFDMQPDDWSMMKDPSDHKFTIPIQWSYWITGMSDYFYVYFWYGKEDLMSENEDDNVGPPKGFVRIKAADIIVGDSAIAYVPFNAMEPEVTIAAAWYCDTTFDISIEPDVFTLPMNDLMEPIPSFGLLPGGDTRIANTLMFPEFTGMCNAQKLDGEFVADAGDGKLLFLEFWEDNYDGQMRYSLYTEMTDPSGNPGDMSTIADGPFTYLTTDSVEFDDQYGVCNTIGSYSYQISNDSLTFLGVDECIDRITALTQYTFVRRDYDKEYMEMMSGCPGDPVKFVLAGGKENTWHFGDGETGIGQIAYHTYQDTGFYDAFVVVTNGCDRTDTVRTPVRIGQHNIPYVNFFMSDHNIEVNEAVQFNVSRWGDDFDPNTYLWDFGDGFSSTERDPSHVYKKGGEYKIVLEITNGCGSASDYDYIYVNGGNQNCNLTVDFNFKVEGDTVRFFEATSGVIPTKFKWEFSDGTVSTKPNPVRVFTDAGAYSACLIVEDSISGCSDDMCKDFVIGNVEFYADFDAVIDNQNMAAFFVDKSPMATEWNWNFGDDRFSTEQNPLHYYDMPGYYEVTLFAYSDSVNLGNFTTKYILVEGTDSVECFINFSYEVQDLTVSFIADASDNITGGFWKFGDGNTSYEKDVTHTYTKPGVYNVCATVFDSINDCQKTICKPVTVGKVDCQAEFTFIINEDYSVDFFNESKGMNLEYSWDLGDGTYSNEFELIHDYIPGEEYLVTLAISDTISDCGNDYSMKIYIADRDNEQICTPPEISYFTQDGTFSVEFDEVSGQEFTEYYWDFGDGSFSGLKSPSHTYANADVYEVCLQAYDDSTKCGQSICQKVIIQDASTTIVSVDADFGVLVNQSTKNVTFTDKSTGNITSRYWTFGDGKMAADSVRIKHYYAVPKTYEACLIVVDEDNGLKSKVCKDVIVGMSECNLVADFNYIVDPVDNLIKFTDNSRGTANKWSWNFDDGTTSQRENPFHMYDQPGYYLVQMAVRDTVTKCNDVHFKLIQVGSVECKALFDYEVDPDNLTVEFSNESRGNIAEYYWYFGDHSSSNLENPVKQYEKPGLYRVALAVNNSTGDCADYVIVPVQVGEVSCEADFEVFVDSVDNVAYFENKSIGNIQEFRWFFGDGYQSTRENPVHFYPAPGYYTARLVTASGDCMSKAEETILVGAQGMDCEADFFASVDENNQTVKFIDQSLGEDLAYLWDFGDDSITTEPSPVYTYETGGFYNVCLTVINSNGISNTTCKFIQVSTEDYNSCFADFIYTADSTTKTVEFIDVSAGNPNRWIWHFGDGASSNEQNPSHTYNEAGFYNVKLVSGDTTSGCASVTFDLVNVGEEATGLMAGFGYQIDSLTLKGSGKPVDFVGISTGKSSNFSWSFGDGNSDSITLTPTNIYAESGTYEVCFTVSDPITGMSNTYCDSVVVLVATYVDEMIAEGHNLVVYPNPFKDELRIRYSIDKPTNVDIEVYDELGRLIDVIVQGYKYEGDYEVVWRKNSVSNGIYNLRMRTDTGIIKNLRIIKN